MEVKLHTEGVCLSIDASLFKLCALRKAKAPPFLICQPALLTSFIGSFKICSHLQSFLVLVGTG